MFNKKDFLDWAQVAQQNNTEIQDANKEYQNKAMNSEVAKINNIINGQKPCGIGNDKNEFRTHLQRNESAGENYKKQHQSMERDKEEPLTIHGQGTSQRKTYPKDVKSPALERVGRGVGNLIRKIKK